MQNTPFTDKVLDRVLADMAMPANELAKVAHLRRWGAGAVPTDTKQGENAANGQDGATKQGPTTDPEPLVTDVDDDAGGDVYLSSANRW